MILNNYNLDSFNYIQINNDSFNDKNIEYRKTFITDYFNTYDIAELYLVNYNEKNLDINNENDNTFIKIIDEDFQNYIKFYLNQLNDPDYNKYDYIIIAKTKSDKYATFRIKKIENNTPIPTPEPTPTPTPTTNETNIYVTANSTGQTYTTTGNLAKVYKYNIDGSSCTNISYEASSYFTTSRIADISSN